MQLRLLQWIRFYKSLNELPATDRPDDDTINDDAECDRWFDDYQRRMAQQTAEMQRVMAQRGLGPGMGGGGKGGFDVPQFGG